MNELAELGVSIEHLKDAIVTENCSEALRLIEQVDELAAELIRLVNKAQREYPGRSLPST